MPVVLDPDRQAQWLDPANRDAVALFALLQQAPSADWTLTPVSRRVNNARTDDLSLIEPIAGPLAATLANRVD